MKAGAADAQLWGTDSMPSEAARPTPVDTATFPIPAALNMPVPEPTPPLSADPKSCIWLPNAWAAGLREFMNEFAELNIETPIVPIDADDPAPDATDDPAPEARLVAEFIPEVKATDAELRLDTDDSSKVDDEEDVVVVAVDATTPDSALGAAVAELSGVVVTTELSGADNGVDSIEVNGADAAEASGATVWAPVPAEVLAAWPTAAACPADAVELVTGAGGDHGLSTDAACAEP